jgi:hypothetical protein
VDLGLKFIKPSKNIGDSHMHSSSAGSLSKLAKLKGNTENRGIRGESI